MPLATAPALGYIVTVGVFATVTSLALMPPRRPRLLAKIGFLVGTIVNEVPHLYLAGLLAATTLAFAEGDIDSTAGWMAAGLAVLASVGLLVVIRRALATEATVTEALEDGLGTGWQGSLDVARPNRQDGHWPLARIVAAPWFASRVDVRRFRDLAYGEADRRNLLDVYRHRSLPSRSPTLVYLHGGGYFSGAKSREARPLLYRLASQGWTCVSANYRLRPEVGFPDHLIDAKRATAWVRDHGAELGADPNRIVVAGSSAGAHLAAFIALTPNDPTLQPGFEETDTSVSAAVCLYGYLGPYYGQGCESAPASRLRADAPPFFIAQGSLDTYSPRFVAIARGFAAQLRAASSSPVVYAELPGAQHGFDLFHSLRFEAVIDGIEAFAAAAFEHKAARPEKSL